MAKKKDLSSLVGGIIGKQTETPATPTTPAQEQAKSSDLDKELVEAMQITPEMEEQLNALRKSKVGRHKGTTRKPPRVETRATFVVDPEQVRKIKYISLASGRLHKDVIGEALTRYIDEWESNNGVINLPNLTD